APLVLPASNPDPAAVRLDDAPGDREAQAGAPAIILPPLPEPIEHVRKLIRRDARAMVAHRDQHPVAAPLAAHLDRAADVGELDRVADEVADHTNDFRPIDVDRT